MWVKWSFPCASAGSPAMKRLLASSPRASEGRCWLAQSEVRPDCYQPELLDELLDELPAKPP